MRQLAFLLLLGTCSVASAAPTLGPPLSDHAVLQRGRPIPIWGTAAPRESVTVSLGKTSKTVRADSDGRWRVDLPPMTAGGPYDLTASSGSGQAAARDVVIGDVWLCSGQSNMEYPVRRSLNGEGEAASAADGDLRLMKIPQQLADTPQRSFSKTPAWRAAEPESVGGFSAACYFMVRALRSSQKVPIGAIDDSWGGTPIRAWSDEGAVRASGGTAAADLAALHRSNATAGVRRFGEDWGAWWRSQTGDAVGREPWNSRSGLQWKPVPSLGYWDDWGPEWKAHIGAIWAERTISLTAAEASAPATLLLSAIDDIDQTFVNGVAVGGLNDPTNSRSYVVPADVLKVGDNRIVVYVRNAWGGGGFKGPASEFALKLADGTTKPLQTGWHYAKIADSIPGPPAAPWGSSSGVSTIYNAMVAPLGPTRFAGVAWYQGEADVGQAGYDRRLAAWMSNWRNQFEDPRLPFLIVGLAGWGAVSAKPTESGWAALIDEQRLAVQRDPRTALVSAIDLGEPADIHPSNKQEVGRRLALAARSVVYGDAAGKVGPMPLGAEKAADTILIRFSKPLQTLSASQAMAFEICDAPPNSCRYANAHVEDDKAVLQGDGRPITRVRYAWSDFPIVNLYDFDGLPVPVFELSVH